MKVYFFDCITGVYQGEGFEDEAVIDMIEGVTAVAPPPYCKGEMAVYNCESNVWTVKAIRPKTASDPPPG
ncbi:hypothetical protein [Geobacter sulfurreducens]|uniref:hypothetical protein n=1 Tax=Geobacter sulfurreducens TaxID=35554 RepID=UPI002C99ACCB|nr:hypothetical protein [Geobacter sulfurreducens]HML78680.1 hypothetical protein [Geobacter sulfurreducens]